MKTKITIIAFLMCLFTIHQESQSQIIVHDDGQITFQHHDGNWNHGVQIFPSGCTHFNSTRTDEWHWVTVKCQRQMLDCDIS